MPTVDLVVFDMAGTTIQDDGQVVDAFTSALTRNGIPVTERDLRPWRGASKRRVLRVFVEGQFGPDDPQNTARVERVYAEFREQLERRFTVQAARPIPGAPDTFVWLRDRGIKVALTTGFYRKVADIILDTLGWRPELIAASVSSDEVPAGRPAPYMIFRAMETTGVSDVRRVMKVGDTAFDLMAGRNAGLLGVVGVLSGSQDVEQLGRVQHTHIIPSVAELPNLLESEFGRSDAGSA
jgi:phosphonatase-like hydrolase